MSQSKVATPQETFPPSGEPLSVCCLICGRESALFDEGEILRKYKVKYFRCCECGFIQTERPYWLEEAYSTAIAPIDTGVLFRNLQNRKIVSAVLNLLFPRAELCLDYGAGHGIFVRLMRDEGFDFRWYDLHATNDYARGFEHGDGKTYDFLTSFEVLEHLANPLAELSKIMDRSPNILVTTELVPTSTPRIQDWWYYACPGGQHISLYTPQALKLIAARFGRHLLSHGPYHLFTTEPANRLLFRLAVSRRMSAAFAAIRKRESLVQSDFELISK